MGQGWPLLALKMEVNHQQGMGTPWNLETTKKSLPRCSGKKHSLANTWIFALKTLWTSDLRKLEDHKFVLCYDTALWSPCYRSNREQIQAPTQTPHHCSRMRKEKTAHGSFEPTFWGWEVFSSSREAGVPRLEC